LTFAANATASTLVTAIDAIAGGNWDATLRTNSLSLDLHRIGGQDALRRDVAVSFPDRSDFEYWVDEDAGLVSIIRSAWFWEDDVDGASFGRGWRNVLVEYTGGYATIPDDLEQIAIELVAEAFNARGKDTSLQSESIGSYSYVNRALEGPQGKVFRDRLEQWKRYTA